MKSSDKYSRHERSISILALGVGGPAARAQAIEAERRLEESPQSCTRRSPWVWAPTPLSRVARAPAGHLAPPGSRVLRPARGPV